MPGVGLSASRILQTFPRSPLVPAVALAAVLVLALYVRWIIFFSVVRIDSFEYIDVALRLLRREPVFVDGGTISVLYTTRLSVVGPLAAAFALLGATERTAVLWPLLCSLLGVAATFAIGWRLGGAPVAALAGLAMALYPPEIIHAT